MTNNFGFEHPYILILLIPIAIILYLYIKKGGMSRKKWIFLSGRFFLISLITVALASPYVTEKKDEFQDLTSINILSDSSGSMSIYDNISMDSVNLYTNLKTRIGNITNPESVGIRYFSEGNRTAIGDALYQDAIKKSKENNLIVLVSDGNNNYGRNSLDVARILSNTNTTVFVLAPGRPENEIYIPKISGDNKIPANAEYNFRVDIRKTGEKKAKYKLNLYIDDNRIKTIPIVQNEPLISLNFTTSFEEMGIHKIVAEILPEENDYLTFNNKFYKAVEVIEKPNILVVTDNPESPLVTILKKNYNVIASGNFNRNLKSFDTVFIDNQNEDKLTGNVVDSLQNYVVDGNGLIVIGGDNSYEQGGYHGSSIEGILPVISTEEPKKRRREMAVVFVIDISESTEYGIGGNSKIDTEKALAINMIRQLDLNDSVGVIAFNVNPFLISDIKKLSQNKDDVENKILSLKFGGGTDMLPALLMSDKLLQDFSGSRFVIVISDGVIGRRDKIEPTLEQAKSMSRKGMKVYSVGVGFDTDENFMSQLANMGNGIYFKPEAYERLRLEFESRGKEAEKDYYTLAIYNKYHFITEDINLQGISIKKFNGVTEKSIAQVLITTENKGPILTVWRFGLGRVASITTDNGLLWSGNLYKVENGKLISAITNWAIGDLEKKKPVKIDIGGSAILIKSEDTLTLIVQDSSNNKEEVPLRQTDIGEYSAVLNPDGTGFYMLKAVSPLGEDTDAIVVNYPAEYSNLGVNAGELQDIAMITGGRFYNSSQMKELEEDIMDYAKKGSLKTVVSKTLLYPYLAALALSLFFIDVITRRIGEIIKKG